MNVEQRIVGWLQLKNYQKTCIGCCLYPITGNSFKSTNQISSIWIQLIAYSFWSQLIFDHGARGALLSYLEFAPRSYDQELTKLEQEQKSILAELHSSVFKVYMRITTLKESDVCGVCSQYL
jgi:DNA-binding transcriptional regulator of glucitol operon